MKRFLQNALLIAVSVSVSLLAAEAAVRAFYDRIANYNLEMWRYAAEMKQPLSSRALPFHHAPDSEGRYYGVTIRTNSMGFRDREHTMEKPEGKRRVIFLGDSFTLGWGVPFEKTFPEEVERLLNAGGEACEVINMGVGNYNTSMEVELFKLKGLRLKPDLVVLMYFINDAEPTPEADALWQRVARRSYLAAFVMDRYLRMETLLKGTGELDAYYRGLYDRGSKGLALNSAAARELMRLCKDKGIRLLVVNIPDPRVLEPYPFSYATEHLRRLAEEGGVPFLDLLPWFSGREPESLWVSGEDPHMNAKANMLAAEAIYQKILSDKLL